TLSMRDTQRAIKTVREVFQNNLCSALNLERISAPLFVTKSSGINDDLNGVERAVSFDIKNMADEGEAVIVHSLAKWKRTALKKYGFKEGEGLYTDMNAIRRDEDTDNLHSVYVDQWDWEKVINRADRTEDFLKSTVQKIVDALCDTLETVKKEFPTVTTNISRDVHFVTAQELEDLYPSLTPKEREKAAAKEYGTIFVMKIGDILKSGIKHDGRAPDYDDWNLNGDIIIYNEVLEDAFEVSSMGIRVDEKSLDYQLKASGKDERRNFQYHKDILNNNLPLTIGGGIGQSRVCMLLLGKLHIGEVQASLWPQEMRKVCSENGVNLL
ncbi:MAG: aspartate--ammonia ligase, partial [Oscillospiraceae bacterium]|nr:aspartate--ammonia ligase [Oscillospiraceae bacterium]